MKKTFLMLIVLAMLACPVFAKPLSQKQIQFVDEWGQGVDMTTSVSILFYDATTTDAQTVYKDKAGAKTCTSPITDDSLNTPIDYSTGLMTFWSTNAAYKLVVTDGTFTRTVDELTSSDTRFYWPSILSVASSTSYGQNDDIDFTYAGWIIDGDTVGRLDMIPDADGSILGIGDTSTQSDVYIYASSTQYLFWEEGEHLLNVVHSLIEIDDDSYLYFGDDQDISIKYDQSGDDLDITGDGSELAIGASGAGLDVFIHGQTGNYIEFDEDNDRLYFEDINLRIDDGSAITFYHTTGTAVDWTVQMAAEETLVFLPTESSDDQTFNIGNATYTSDFRLFGASASTVVFNAGSDRVIFSTYDIEVEDTADLVIGSDDEWTIDNSTEVLRIIASDSTDDFQVILGVTTEGVDLKVWGATGTEYVHWDASADSFTVVGDLALFTLTGSTKPFYVHATTTIAGTAIELATTNGGILFTAGGGTNGDWTATVGDTAFIDATGQLKLTSSSTAASSILLTIDGGASSTMKFHADAGTASTVNAASIQFTSDGGGIQAVATANTSVTELASAVQLTALLGGIELYSGLSADNAIKLTADGDATTEIDIFNDTGTTQDAIGFLTDVGGVQFTNSAVPDGQKGVVMAGTLAGATYSEGLGAYVSGAITGNADGKVYAFGAWLDITAGTPTDGPDSLLAAADFGIYAAAAPELATSQLRVINLEYQVHTDAAPVQKSSMMHFNCDDTGDVPDYWFTTGNDAAVVYGANTTHSSASTDKVGAIKININPSVANGYIYVYSHAGQ